MNRKSPKEYLEMCRKHIEDVVNDNCGERYLSARIKAAGNFENLILSLLQDEKYFKGEWEKTNEKEI